ncbi:21712_t:CDS:2, partial [Rhizophagus irregularis]
SKELAINVIEFDRLSLEALQYLLSYTQEKTSPLQLQNTNRAGSGVFHCFPDVTLFKRLPVLEQVEYIQVENNTDCQKVADILEPLIKYIDLKSNIRKNYCSIENYSIRSNHGCLSL